MKLLKSRTSILISATVIFSLGNESAWALFNKKKKSQVETVQCLADQSALSSVNKIEKMAQVFVPECRPSDKSTWSGEGYSYNNPCACASHTRYMDRFTWNRAYEEEYDKLEKVPSLVHQKMLNTLKARINGMGLNLLQSDVALKKRNLKDSDTNDNSFPESCRLSKVGDLIKHLKTKSQLSSGSRGKSGYSCPVGELEKNVDYMFGKGTFKNIEKDGIGKYQKDYINKFEAFASNKLTDEDKEKNYCFPYKSYLSINNDHYLRRTYLQAIASLNSVEMKDENNNQLTAYQKFLKLAKGSGNTTFNDLVKKNNPNALEINSSDVKRLMQIDPLFQNLINDENFFNQLSGDLTRKNASNRRFEFNTKQFQKKILESQNKQCNEMFGFNPDSLNNGSAGYDSLLEEALCNQEFFRKVASPDDIEEILGSDLGQELNIKPAALAKDMLIVRMQCRGILGKRGDLRNAYYDKYQAAVSEPNTEMRKNLLSVSLNPPSEFDNAQESHFDEFNKKMCPLIKEECKAGTKSTRCTTIEGVTSLMARKKFEQFFGKGKEKEASELFIQWYSGDVTDRKMREILTEKFKDEPDIVSHLMSLRTGILTRKYSELDEQVRSKDYLNELVGNQKIITVKNKSPEKFEEILKKLRENGDTDLADKLTLSAIQGLEKIEPESVGTTSGENVSSTSSYFANYFALGDSNDESAILAARSNPQRKTTQNVPGTEPGTDVSVANQAVYQRKAFDVIPKTAPDTGGRVIVGTKPDDKGNTGTVPGKTNPDLQDEPTIKSSGGGIAGNLGLDGGSDGASSGAFVSFNSTGGSSTDYSRDNTAKVDNLSGRSTGGLSSQNNSAEDDKVQSLRNQINELKEMANRSSADSLAGAASADESEASKLNKKISELENEYLNSSRRSRGNNSGNNPGRGIASSSGNYLANDGRSYNNSAPYDVDTNNEDPFERGETSREVTPQHMDKIDPKGEPLANKATSASSGAVKSASASGGNVGSGGDLSLANLENEGRLAGLMNFKPLKKGRRPASANGELDADDICGDTQFLNCIIEYNNIFNRARSIGEFIDNLMLYGKSFRSIETVRFKKDASARKYFLHLVEPAENLSEEEKEKIFQDAKMLLKNYKKNRKALKELATKAKVVKTVEISKEEAHKLLKYTLKKEDIDNLIIRRAMEVK